jgi:hypothetical protein
MPQALVQRRFAGGVGGEAVLEGAEARCGAGVRGHEDEGVDWDGWVGELEDGGGDEEGADGVGCEVVAEFREGSRRNVRFVLQSPRGFVGVARTGYCVGKM